jgi:hypothetical protein
LVIFVELAGSTGAVTFAFDTADGVSGTRFVKYRAVIPPIASTPHTMEMMRSF